MKGTKRDLDRVSGGALKPLWKGITIGAKAVIAVGKPITKFVMSVANGIGSFGKLTFRCVMNFIICADNVKLAIVPIVVFAVTVAVGTALVGVCVSTLLGCVVSLPLLAGGTGFGLYTTYNTAERLWWGPGRDKVYHKL